MAAVVAPRQKDAEWVAHLGSGILNNANRQINNNSVALLHFVLIFAGKLEYLFSVGRRRTTGIITSARRLSVGTMQCSKLFAGPCFV